MKTRTIQQIMLYKHRYKIGIALMIGLSFAVLSYRLESLVPGISQSEAMSGLDNSSIRSIGDNPLNAPFKLLQWGSIQALGSSALALRAVSVLFGAFFLSLLFGVFKMWHKQRIAILGVMFVAGSSWFLNFARLGTDYIVLPTMLLLLFMLMSWVHHSKHTTLASYVVLLFLSVTLYTPYMVLFVLLATMVYFKSIRQLFMSYKTVHRVLLPLLFAALMTPLIFAFISDPSLLNNWLGVPEKAPSLIDLGKNLMRTFSFMFWDATPSPELHLGSIAMLDIFTATMTALGLYHYERHTAQLRTKILMNGFIFAIAVVSFRGDQTSYGLLLPFVYIFAATGIITMLNQWNQIFPKNPFARTLGFLPIALVVFSTMFYHTNRYFYAWAKSVDTKKTFVTEPTHLRQDIKDNTIGSSGSIAVIAPQHLHQRITFLLSDHIGNYIFIADAADKIDAESLKGHSLVYVTPGQEIPGLKEVLGDPTRFVVSERHTNSRSFNVYEVKDEPIQDIQQQ